MSYIAVTEDDRWSGTLRTYFVQVAGNEDAIEDLRVLTSYETAVPSFFYVGESVESDESVEVFCEMEPWTFRRLVGRLRVPDSPAELYQSLPEFVEPWEGE